MSSFPADSLAATEEICQREPLAARTRHTLLRLEKDGHRAGWDSPTNAPTLFRFDRQPQRDYVTAERSELTVALHAACDLTGGDAGEALVRIAEVMEGARDTLRSLNTSVAADGFGFYGYALRHEAWTTYAVDDDEVLADARAQRLHTRPDRIEIRMVCLVARDGLRWMCMRERRNPPVRVVAMRPEANFEGAGRVMHALGRMTNAAASNPVPVPRLVDEEVLRRARRA